MKPFTCIIACVGVLTVCATEYWADPVRGDDTRTGTSPTEAFRTLKAATARLRAGDVLHLSPGARFGETLALRTSGTATRPIIVKGHGSVLSGLEPVPDASWIDKGGGLWLSPNKMFWGACRPRVLLPSGEMISVPVSHIAFRCPERLSPGAAAWNKEGIWFRPEAGHRPQTYALRGFYRVSGVEIVGQHYLVVEDLTAEHFTNDGFNVHGSCRGLVFRNITARENGDDGFSVHEDVMVNVYGLLSHGNDNGIADIALSQSLYCGARVVSNRLCGLDFHGGVHAVRDSVVSENGGMQIWVRSRPSVDPMSAVRVFLEDVSVIGGEGAGLTVCEHAEASVHGCTIRGMDVGLSIKGGRLHFSGSSVAACRTAVQTVAGGILTQENCTGLETEGK